LLDLGRRVVIVKRQFLICIMAADFFSMNTI